MDRLEDAVYDFLLTQLICEDVAVSLRHVLLQQTICPHCDKPHNLNTLLPPSQMNTLGETEEVLCNECGKKSAAGRYAAHLEKCLGIGRQAAIAASRKVTSSSTTSSPIKQTSQASQTKHPPTPSKRTAESKEATEPPSPGTKKRKR
jgi:hypothetical protein